MKPTEQPRPHTTTKTNQPESGEIILYQPNSSIKIEVRLDSEMDTVWLTQQQIADLFATKRPAITKHLANIFKSGELDQTSTCSILEHMGNDGKQHYSTKYYNLDVIMEIGTVLRSVSQSGLENRPNFPNLPNHPNFPNLPNHPNFPNLPNHPNFP